MLGCHAPRLRGHAHASVRHGTRHPSIPFFVPINSRSRPLTSMAQLRQFEATKTMVLPEHRRRVSRPVGAPGCRPQNRSVWVPAAERADTRSNFCKTERGSLRSVRTRGGTPFKMLGCHAPRLRGHAHASVRHGTRQFLFLCPSIVEVGR